MNEIPERLWNLLADKATVGLEPPEEAELRALLDRHPGVEASSFDHLAALLEETCPLPREPLPPELSARIAAEASLLSSPSILTPTREIPWFALSGWLTAAALLLVWLGTWLMAPRAMTPEMARSQMLAASTTTTFGINSTDPQQPIQGDLAWNDDSQEGYLKVRGVPANDPAEATYQIWIFDSTRIQQHPVDGGVFDVVSGGEILVPLRPALKIRNATHFVITREPAGGVVVSDRKNILFVAAGP